MNISAEKLEQILEAAIMVAGRPLTVANMQKLFDEGAEPNVSEIKTALSAIQEKYQANSGIELKEVASGYQFQAKTEASHWLSRLWEERAPRYSRAFLETLALVAYRQPVTRAEIEEIRGVSASSHIIKTLQDREWIRVLGFKDVPGKPALYGTTKTFLDYFNLKSLDELPTLAELKDLATQEAKLQVELDLENANNTQENKSNPVTSAEIIEIYTDKAIDHASTEEETNPDTPPESALSETDEIETPETTLLEENESLSEEDKGVDESSTEPHTQNESTEQSEYN